MPRKRLEGGIPLSVFDVPAQELIEAIASDLKKNRKLEKPAFTDFAKSGAHRERAPQNRDWWFIRCASILRRLYVDGPNGVQSLRTYYGGRKARGTKPHRFRKAGGKVIRTCLQALEKQGFLEKKEAQGRRVSPAGAKYLNLMSKELSSKIEELKKEAVKRKIERQKLLAEKEKERKKIKEMKETFKKVEKKEKKKAKEKVKVEAKAKKKTGKGKGKAKTKKKKK